MDFKTMTKEEIAEFIKKTKEAQKAIASARKEGLIEKAPKKEREKTAEYLLLAGQFKAVIESNLDTIKKAFEATKTTDKPIGNTGINFRVKDELFFVQVLNQTAMDAKKKALADEAKKAKAEPAKEEAKPEEAKTE